MQGHREELWMVSPKPPNSKETRGEKKKSEGDAESKGSDSFLQR